MMKTPNDPERLDISTVTTFLRSLGETLIAYGNLEEQIEKELGKKPEEIDLMELINFDELEKMVKTEDPEILGRLAVIMLEFISILRKIKDINALPPNEKREVGEKLKKISKQLEELIQLMGETHGSTSS